MVVLLTSCGVFDPNAIPTPIPGDPSTAVDQPTADGTSTPPTVQTALVGGRARHTFKAGGVTVKVEYSTPVRVEKWVPGVDQPLNLSMSASNQGGSAPKIYLSRVTASLYLTDQSGPMNSPEPIIDAASFSPGYLVTSPTSYTQVFVLPAAPDESSSLKISFKYEMLLEQPNSRPRDFQKRTATDSLLVFRR
jgi:hypothetical protein